MFWAYMLWIGFGSASAFAYQGYVTHSPLKAIFFTFLTGLYVYLLHKDHKISCKISYYDGQLDLIKEWKKLGILKGNDVEDEDGNPL